MFKSLFNDVLGQNKPAAPKAAAAGKGAAQSRPTAPAVAGSNGARAAASKRPPAPNGAAPARLRSEATKPENMPEDKIPLAADEDPKIETGDVAEGMVVQVEIEDEAEGDDDKTEKKASQSIEFKGEVLTAANGPLKIAPESRNLCALFATGLWLVSGSHRTSPLVTSVALAAKRQGYIVNDAIYVSPDVIRQAYYYADRAVSTAKLDDNAIRRKIVEVLEAARNTGANDIHIEAAAGRTKVEFRLESRLRVMETWTQREGDQFLSAVYSHSSVASGATANWMEPQAAMLERSSGADTIALPDGVISVRCQWMPLADGRYLNMRLSYDSSHIFGEGFIQADVDTLGFTPEQTDLIRVLRATPGRIRCITGPTNQGKTTTLRMMLNRRMAETNMEMNCLLIEDPPEGGVIGARQIGVSATTNDDQRERTFQGIIRASLRLDPDIVMLGEVRDMQTASFLFKLALSGRQVYTTLHVYSALAVPQRLRDIGMEKYLVYDHELLYGMMCQRLMRGLCKHCRLPILDVAKYDTRVEELARRTRAAISLLEAERQFIEHGDTLDHVREPDMHSVFMENPEGCKHCDFKGRKGRTVAAEVVEADAKLMRLLAEDNPGEAKAYWVSPGGLNGITMKMHAMMKVMKGEVSPTDAEFEMGLLIREKEMIEVEKKIGTFNAATYS